jgi:nitrite reductase/ring-hydroxylating ferredoxin subunit
MGDTMRRYWMPALLSWELEADGAPVRLKLLGESLLAFRDTSGRVGVFDEMCPHRGASLWLGRNEENGLRCVYHGWKYDVTGQCVDMMNEPEEFDFKAKIKVVAYPTEEFGGVIWTYMGPADKRPASPKFEWTQVAEPHRYVTKVWQECNWLQSLEGGIDTSHAPIMHRALKKNPAHPGIGLDSPFVRGSAPTLEVENTDYGYRYFGIRTIDEDAHYVRGYHFIMPFTQLRPVGGSRPRVDGHFWVPMDDENVMVYNFGYSYGEEPLTLEESSDRSGGNNFGEDVDIHNGFMAVRNKGNDWLIERDVQKTDTFTGIKGINTQDRATQESMGKVMDRTKEHLGAADRAVIGMRKLLEAAIQVNQDGGDPPGLAPTYYNLRAADDVIPASRNWREEIMAAMYPTEPAASMR